MYSFPDLEPVSCSMSSSNCCFLTCIQISQEAGQVVWWCLFQNFPQFVVIHTVKGFIVVSEAEIDVFLKFSCFFCDPVDVSNLISGSSAFLKSCLRYLNYGKEKKYLWVSTEFHMNQLIFIVSYDRLIKCKVSEIPTICDNWLG